MSFRTMLLLAIAVAGCPGITNAEELIVSCDRGLIYRIDMERALVNGNPATIGDQFVSWIYAPPQGQLDPEIEYQESGTLDRYSMLLNVKRFEVIRGKKTRDLEGTFNERCRLNPVRGKRVF